MTEPWTIVSGITAPLALLVSGSALYVAGKQHRHDTSRDNAFGMSFGVRAGDIERSQSPEFDLQEFTVQVDVRGPNPRHTVHLLFFCDNFTNYEEDSFVKSVLKEADGMQKRTAKLPVRSLDSAYAAVAYLATSGTGVRNEAARIPLSGPQVVERWHWYRFQKLRQWWAWNRPMVGRNTESLQRSRGRRRSDMEHRVALVSILPNHAARANLGEWRRDPGYFSVDGTWGISNIPRRRPGPLRRILGTD